jgi:lipid II isoglutaminyl synthase (glutamine-hydrolysing)
MKLTLYHLFPKIMNLYGDMGNIMTLQYRAYARDIEIEYVEINSLKKVDFSKCDIIFFGGGQDNDQLTVYNEFCNYETGIAGLAQTIKEEVEKNKVFLLVCGGYQLFGNYFIDGLGNRIEGLGVVNVNTKALGDGAKERNIGNIVIETVLPIKPKTLVGFENHSGQTDIQEDKNFEPLGKVVTGYGNNLHSGFEGVHYKNVFGTYMHGALLPKNPHFADYLLSLALKTKYKKDITLKPLDDELELKAHDYIVCEYTKK